MQLAWIKVASLVAVMIGVTLKAPLSAEPTPATQTVVATGFVNPQLQVFDRLMISFVKEHNIPGVSIAISNQGRLVYARGFGVADLETKESAQPTSLFRIASISKPITAVAILQLAERQYLKLDDKVFDILQYEPHLEKNASVDPRLRGVTIRQLMQHSGGFDRSRSFDPMFRSVEIAKSLGVDPPARPEHVIRYMMGRKLDFDPGKRYAYSNFGYCLLGRVIEKLTGMQYEQYVRCYVLGPAGVSRMRIGKTLPDGRAAGEVRYYFRNGQTGSSVFGSNVGTAVPEPYGAWYLEAMDSHGAWIASAVDLVRFAVALENTNCSPLLSAASRQTMLARPTGGPGFEADGKPKANYYACGWQVQTVGTDGLVNSRHTGSLPGTSTILFRHHHGLNWAVLFNTRDSKTGRPPSHEVNELILKTVDEIECWPRWDLFCFYGTDPGNP